MYDGEFYRGVKHGHGVYVYRKDDGLVSSEGVGERWGASERGRIARTLFVPSNEYPL